MNLCYNGPETLAEVPERHPDRKIRVGKTRIHGDNLAATVLECLAEIACLHGDQIILLQYFPYAWDLFADNLLVNVLFPVLQIITSRATSFIGGWRPDHCSCTSFLMLSTWSALGSGRR